MTQNLARFIVIGLGLVLLLIVLLATIFILLPGRRIAANPSQYVALGSSYAAGLGLGDRVPGSAVVAGRTVNSYPQKFARMAGLSLIDMTWSGSTSGDLLRTGAFYQRPQIDGVGPETKVVTITTGGNDVRYGGDLVMLSYRNKNAALKWLIDLFANAPLPAEQRNFETVYRGITSAIAEIKRRAPGAIIVVVTYPPVLPEHGTCSLLRMSEQEVALMRPVAEKLAAVTRAAASDSGVALLDVATLGRGHEACSSEPWTRGALTDETPFHPSNTGTDAIALELAKMLPLR